jgi:hypothetical protein
LDLGAVPRKGDESCSPVFPSVLADFPSLLSFLDLNERNPVEIFKIEKGLPTYGKQRISIKIQSI